MKQNIHTTEMKTIGVAGAGTGVGTTHLCITLAGKLNSMGYRVGVLEENRNNDFRELAGNLEYENIDRDPGFVHKNIEYWFKGTSLTNTLADIKSENYDYLIVDFGNYRTCNHDYYLTCSYNIIVASARYWNFAKLKKNLFEIEKPGTIESYNFVFPFAYKNKKLQEEIVESMDSATNVFFSPYNEDPFEDFNIPCALEILGLENEVPQSSERRSFFGSLKKKPKQNEKQIEEDNYIRTEYESLNTQKEGFTMEDLRSITDTALASGITNITPAMNSIQSPKPVSASPSSSNVYAPIKEDIPAITYEEDIQPDVPITPAAPITKSISTEVFDLYKDAKFIAKSSDFDVVKSHKNAYAITKTMDNQLSAMIRTLINNGATVLTEGSELTIEVNGQTFSYNIDRYNLGGISNGQN